MPLQAKVLSCGRSFKSLVSPVISVTIHSDIQRALGFPNILLSTLATRDFFLVPVNSEEGESRKRSVNIVLHC